MRIASIDIGTNTVLLLVADVDERGVIHPVEHQQRLPRLGKDVDRDGRIHVSSFDRIAWILNEYKNLANQLGAKKIISCATSAVRDASNKDEFIVYVKKSTGIDVKILSGDEEATITYRGAISGFRKFEQPVAVIDIGGGSTEFSYPTPEKHNGNLKLHRYSLQLGAVRLTERFFKHNPPDPSEIQSAVQYMIEEFAQVRNPGFSNYALVAVAGTATTLACLDQKLDEFDVEKVSGYKMSRDRISQWAMRLSTMTSEQISSLSKTTEGREDILTAGVMILENVMKHFGFSTVVISERGLRYGIILRELSL